MTLFELWAPNAGSVAVEALGRRTPMRASERGFWVLDLPDAGPGTAYGFVLDGEERAIPDPRARYLPGGVHGPAVVVDDGAYAWKHPGFRQAPLGHALVYELHVGTFTPGGGGGGTFASAIERLDHLAELGVTHVEVMPINAFPGERGWGYDGVGLWAPHAAYCRGPGGEDLGPDAFRAFVDACHGRGMAVVLDAVYNHLGPSGNYLERFGPYFTEKYHTPWGKAVNLDDRDSDIVRRFFVENALMWLREYRVDALRLDAVHAFHDENAVPFLEELSVAVDALEAQTGTPKELIAEFDLNDPRIVRPREAGGLGIDAQWNDEFHHAVHAVLTGERSGYYESYGRVGQIAKALRDAYVYDGQYEPGRRRRHGRPATGLSGHRFVVFTQNHDQVGNRARGERLSALVGEAKLKQAAALLLLAPYVPMLWMGEEWAASTPFQYFTDHQEPELADAVREGRRREFAHFGWKPEDVPDPQSEETFRNSVLRWEELGAGAHARVLEWHRRLVRLRREHPELTDGRREEAAVAFGEPAEDRGGWLRYTKGSITALFNFGGSPAELESGGAGVVLAASPEGAVLARSGVRVPGDGVVIVRTGGGGGGGGVREE